MRGGNVSVYQVSPFAGDPDTARDVSSDQWDAKEDEDTLGDRPGRTARRRSAIPANSEGSLRVEDAERGVGDDLENSG